MSRGKFGVLLVMKTVLKKPHFKEPRIFLAFDPVGPGSMKKKT
jgi:hypothetical protein